jgi:hypothetical protein
LPSAYFWIGAALTGAVVITGTALGMAALSEHADGQRRADTGRLVDSEAADDLALQADIAFGAAIALGVGTTLLFFLTDWGSGPMPDRSPPDVRVAIGGTSRSVSLSITGIVP